MKKVTLFIAGAFSLFIAAYMLTALRHCYQRSLLFGGLDGSMTRFDLPTAGRSKPS